MAGSSVNIDEEKSVKSQIKTELEDLKKMAAAFGPARLRDGTWFNEFVHAMLSSYAEKIIKAGGVEYFRKKYPGLTRDAIAEKLCTLAMRYAAIAGGVTGITASTGVLGGFTIPVIIAAISGEILYTTSLQVRLIYDLATIYGDPIDLNDPEQLYRAFMLAYGISAVSANVGNVAAAAGPEVVRAQAYRLITGRTPMIQDAAIKILGPRIGSLITRKAILKVAVPVAGVAISSGWNYVSTKGIAEAGRQEFKLEAQAKQAAVDLCNEAELKSKDLPIIVQAVQAVINIDGSVDPRELKVYQAIVKCLNVPIEALQEIEARVEINADTVEKQLRALKRVELRKALAELLKLAAASSGTIAPAELNLLNRFLPALNAKLDLNELQAQASRFKRKEQKGLREQAGILGQKISGPFGKKASQLSSEPEPVSSGIAASSPIESSPGQAELLERLNFLHAEGLLTDDELETKKQELSARFTVSTLPTSTADDISLALIHLQTLINLMKVDGVTDKAEVEFLKELWCAVKFNAEQTSDLQSRFAAKHLVGIDFSPYQNHPDEALNLMLDLVNMSRQDGKVQPAEKMYIKKVAEQLRLSQNDVEELLNDQSAT
ncbi:MAG: TerB family tellurite resistance protein [Bellilinea sp.]